MNTKKIETFIGFAIKSRKIAFGEDNIKTSKKIALIIVDADYSDKYKERINRLEKAEVIEIPNLSGLTHRENVHSIAILDENLANGIKQSIEEN